MNTGEKIVTGLALAALIGVLVKEHKNSAALRDNFAMRPADIATIPTARLGVSQSPSDFRDIGPEYLLSNLPKRRGQDYYTPRSSRGGC